MEECDTVRGETKIHLKETGRQYIEVQLWSDKYIKTK